MVTHPKHHALVVDWDFFFHIDPTWDWAHSETPFLINGVWPIRAANFLAAGQPLPEAEDTWQDFFERFTFTDDVRSFTADSNVWAYSAITAAFNGDLPATEVWLFDQHHDSGYKGEKSVLHMSRNRQVTCEDWMVPLGLAQNPKGSLLHVVYPDHRKDAFDEEPNPFFEGRMQRTFNRLIVDSSLPVFDLVFVCRSGAWVPAWEDRKFVRFVKRMPGEPVSLDGWEPRKWSIAEARKIARAFEKTVGKP